MALIAPIDYERYAVLISPSAVAVRGSDEATPVARAAEAIDPKLVDFSLQEGPPFSNQAHWSTPPAPADAVTVEVDYGALPSIDFPSPLNAPTLLPELMQGRENIPTLEIVTKLYEAHPENTGKTVNLMG